MPRKSKEEEIRSALQEYLAIAETHTPEEYPLHTRAVASQLKLSPTTIYKYHLDKEIDAAEQRQKENAKLTGKAQEKRDYIVTIQDLRTQLEQERERNKGLVAHIAIMEANVARLGFDPEEMYRPLIKPVRTVSRAGSKNYEKGKKKRWI
jgi:AcrR family transcriptional regulator